LREREDALVKIIVDYDLCEANAVCMAEAPEVFKVDDDDNLHVLQENPPVKLRAKVEAAVRLCPKQALKLIG
jgi:ferredoxin